MVKRPSKRLRLAAKRTTQTSALATIFLATLVRMVIFRRMVFFVTILVALFVIPSGATDFVDVSVFRIRLNLHIFFTGLFCPDFRWNYRCPFSCHLLSFSGCFNLFDRTHRLVGRPDHSQRRSCN